MLDLFDTPIIPGISTRSDLVSAEEGSLIAAIDAVDLSPFRFQGWEGKRLTYSFGWNYDFDTRQVAKAAAIPDWLLPVRDRMAEFAGLDPKTSSRLSSFAMIRERESDGIATGRSTSTYSGSRSARPPTCGFGGGVWMAASIGSRSPCTRGPPTACRERPGTTGSTASLDWNGLDGR
jgi:hypothetical protein